MRPSFLRAFLQAGGRRFDPELAATPGGEGARKSVSASGLAPLTPKVRAGVRVGMAPGDRPRSCIFQGRDTGTVDDVLLPLVTGLIGLVTGIIGASWRSGLELAVRYDVSLREKRLDAYADLWGLLQPLDRHAAPEAMAGADARALSDELRDWYHQTGGLLMSRSAQRKFVRLRRAVADASGDAGDVDAVQRDIAIQEASSLRTALTGDILSRRGSLLGRDRFAS